MPPDREELERLLAAAIAAARDDLDAPPVAIVEDVLGDIGEGGEPAPPVPMAARFAEERLGEATQFLKDQGETETAGMLAAQIGIGYALLAIRDDAEVFFAGGG